MKFSIIIPYYKGSKYISETLESIFKQSNNHFEIIIIDDSDCDIENKN